MMSRWLLTLRQQRQRRRPRIMDGHFSGLCIFASSILAILSLLTVQVVESGRIFDVTSLSTDTVVTKAGANLTLACPGVTEHSLVLVLEWYCHGCSLGGAQQPYVAKSGSSSNAGQHSSSGEVKLVEYRGESTTVWQNRERVTLSPETYGLNFHPVVTGDSGQYSCLFNGRPLPESITRLVVQGIPDPPGRPLILGFTSRAVNLSWAPPLDSHNSRISHYIIHTRVGEDGDWEKSSGLVTENNRTFYQIKGLEPFTVYSFQVVAVNALGKSPPSKESYYIVTLREVPDGKPTITAAQNASSTSIKLAWRPPPRNTIHGEFLGYRLAYRPRDKGPDSIQEIYIRDPSVESYIIQELQTFTQYLVSLQCFNPEGIGPPTTVAVITDEGVPTKPRNLSIHWVTDSKMQLSWSEPVNPNGKLEGYRIFYMQRNFTDVVTVKPPPPNMVGPHEATNGIVPSLSSNMTFSLSGLEPFTEYKIWVKAFTWKNEGESSVPITVKMDVGGPGPPTIVNLTCQSEEALFVQWRRPLRHHNTVDFYYIDFRRGDWIDFREINVTAQDQSEQSLLIHNLTTNNLYEIRVRGGTRSVLDMGKVYKGEFSDSAKILMEPDCEKVRVFNLPRASDEFMSTLVLATVGSSFLLLFILLTLLVWRRCFQTTYYYLDDPPRIPALGIPNTAGWEGDVSEDMKQAISAHLFSQHVHELHMDGDIGFSKEYEAIQAASVQQEYAAEQSQHPENKQKNRYLNIVAYDHTRVRLQPMPGQKKCVDYVNANYIDGFKKPRAYIGTQGPLPSTFDSFWRMVWEHKVHIIVMITNLVERGRKKCDMYWPKEGTETYGVIQVKLLREDVLATYTVRTLLLRHLKLKKKKKVNNLERTVYQYHYTNWPDHGIPSNPLPVLSFVKKSSMANPPDAGPIIVHCSAGVGRTGAYIVLDSMLRQIKARGDLNIFGFLHYIRSQRNFLVQTEEQYIFIHDALLEAIESGETNINRSYIVRYIHSLLAGSYADEKCQVSSLLEHQFKFVTQFCPKEHHVSSALKVYNLTKNRNLDYVCTDSYRVMLSPRPGIEGSDYINASFLPGHHRLNEFILTQHPLESTIGDFWQLLWDHNVQMVVLLSLVDDQEYPIFWPVHGEDLDLDTFRVKMSQESDRVGYVVRDFTIQSLQDDYELSIKMIQSSQWPYHCSSSTTSIFDLVQVVQKATSETYNGSVVVIDRFGGVEGATFCALSTLYKQLECESFVDVYLYAKLYHEQRPGVWKTLNDYLVLYQSIEALARSRNSELALTPSSPSPLLPPPVIMNGGGGVDTYITIPSVVPTTANGLNGRACHGNGKNGNGTFRAPPDGMETIDHKIVDPIV